MTNPERPTFDDIMAERRRFIGPPRPPQIPKLTPVAQREKVYTMMLDNLVERIAAETAAHTDKS